MAHVMNVLPLDDPYIGSIEWGGYVWTNSDGHVTGQPDAAPPLVDGKTVTLIVY